MAEALGIASSIIAILELSSKIAGYAKAVGGADEERQKFACELSILEDILRRLQTKVEPNAQTQGSKLSATTSLLQAPIKQLEELLRCLEKKLPKSEDAQSSPRLLWPWTHEEIATTLNTTTRCMSYIHFALDDKQRLVVQNSNQILGKPSTW